MHDHHEAKHDTGRERVETNHDLVDHPLQLHGGVASCQKRYPTRKVFLHRLKGGTQPRIVACHTSSFASTVPSAGHQLTRASLCSANPALNSSRNIHWVHLTYSVSGVMRVGAWHVVRELVSEFASALRVGLSDVVPAPQQVHKGVLSVWKDPWGLLRKPSGYEGKVRFIEIRKC